MNKKILIYDKLLKQNNSLRFNKRQSCKSYQNILNISIDLKGKKNNKDKTYKYSNILRNNTNSNLLNIYNKYSKSSKNFYILNLKKKYIKNSSNKNEIIIKRNENYIQGIKNNSFGLKTFKNTSYNKFVYHRKKISKSKNNISNKRRYNNSCESIVIKLKGNKIEEKEVFFNNNLNKRIEIKRNVLNLRKIEKNNKHNKSVVEFKDSKKNIFYHMFNDIIHPNK